METLYFILLLLGAISFGAVIAKVTAKIDLLALGLFFWILVPLIMSARAM